MPLPNFSSDELEAFSQLLDENQAAHEEFVEAFHGSDAERRRAAASKVDRTNDALRQYMSDRSETA